MAITIIQNIPQILVAGVQLIVGLGKAMIEAIPKALKGVWDGIKNGFSSLWDSITGKSNSSKEKIKADTTEMTDSIKASTSQTATNTDVDMQSILNSVTNGFNQANIAGTTAVTDLQANSADQMAQLALKAGMSLEQFKNAVDTSTSSAQLQAIINAQAMANGVNLETASLRACEFAVPIWLAKSVFEAIAS